MEENIMPGIEKKRKNEENVDLNVGKCCGEGKRLRAGSTNRGGANEFNRNEVIDQLEEYVPRDILEEWDNKRLARWKQSKLNMLNANEKTKEIWEDIQEIIGEGYKFPYLVQMYMWGDAYYGERLILMGFIYINGLNPEIFYDFLNARNLYGNKSRIKHYRSIINTFENDPRRYSEIYGYNIVNNRYETVGGRILKKVNREERLRRMRKEDNQDDTSEDHDEVDAVQHFHPEELEDNLIAEVAAFYEKEMEKNDTIEESQSNRDEVSGAKYSKDYNEKLECQMKNKSTSNAASSKSASQISISTALAETEDTRNLRQQGKESDKQENIEGEKSPESEEVTEHAESVRKVIIQSAEDGKLQTFENITSFYLEEPFTRTLTVVFVQGGEEKVSSATNNSDQRCSSPNLSVKNFVEDSFIDQPIQSSPKKIYIEGKTIDSSCEVIDCSCDLFPDGDRKLTPEDIINSQESLDENSDFTVLPNGQIKIMKLYNSTVDRDSDCEKTHLGCGIGDITIQNCDKAKKICPNGKEMDMNLLGLYHTCAVDHTYGQPQISDVQNVYGSHTELSVPVNERKQSASSHNPSSYPKLIPKRIFGCAEHQLFLDTVNKEWFDQYKKRCHMNVSAENKFEDPKMLTQSIAAKRKEKKTVTISNVIYDIVADQYYAISLEPSEISGKRRRELLRSRLSTKKTKKCIPNASTSADMEPIAEIQGVKNDEKQSKQENISSQGPDLVEPK